MSMQRRAIAATRRGRERAKALMTETCVVERASGSITDPDTAVVSESWVTVYTGVCKMQGQQSQATNPIAGGHVFTVEQLMLHFPVSAKPASGDRVTITSSVLDADLVGLQLRLTELARGTYRTADRWNVEAVTG